MCRYLHDRIEEHSVWLSRYSCQRSMFRPSKQPTLSTKEMRESVVREAIIDTSWQKPDGDTRVITKLYPRNYSSMIERVSILPGGDFVLLTLADGAVDVRLIATDASSDKSRSLSWPLVPCANAGLSAPMLVTNSQLIPVSFQEGYIIVVMRHTARLDDHDS